jgi:hypothetical protein
MSITQQKSLSTRHNNNGRVPKLQATFVVVVSLAQKIMFGSVYVWHGMSHDEGPLKNRILKN